MPRSIGLVAGVPWVTGRAAETWRAERRKERKGRGHSSSRLLHRRLAARPRGGGGGERRARGPASAEGTRRLVRCVVLVVFAAAVQRGVHAPAIPWLLLRLLHRRLVWLPGLAAPAGVDALERGDRNRVALLHPVWCVRDLLH